MAELANTPTTTDAAAATPVSWRRRVFRWLRLALIVYLGVLLVLLFFENSLVYHPVSAAKDWQLPPSAEIEDVHLTAADGTALHAWWLPAPGSASAMLYLHGNAGNLSWRGDALLKIREQLGVGVLIVDYPGYGKSAGRPSEQGCYDAGDAGYAWLTDVQKTPPERILLWGASLGGGVAVDLASRKDCRALILIKTFTSLPDVAGGIYPWLPVRWVMRNRFPSIDKITACKRPVFVTHGTTDTLIPYALGERLFAAANAPKTFFAMDKLGHNDALNREMFDELKTFLAKHAP
jgi:fermentation-respiration switch protein FrsA (DUF1100 family)